MNYLRVSYPRVGGAVYYTKILTADFLAEQNPDHKKLSLLTWSGLLANCPHAGYNAATGRATKPNPEHYWEIAFCGYSEAEIEPSSNRFEIIKDGKEWDWTFEPISCLQMDVDRGDLAKADTEIGKSGCTLNNCSLTGTAEQLTTLRKKLASQGISVSDIIKVNSTWKRATGVSRRFSGKTKNLDTTSIYVAGSSEGEVKQQMIQKMLLAQIPVLPEWEDILWDELNDQKMVEPLIGRYDGYGWKGYKINIPREKILTDIFGELLIKQKRAPRPLDLPADVSW